MRKTTLLLLLFILSWGSLKATEMEMADAIPYTHYVNPWIGTGGHGHVFLGANVPFGFIQLGPTEHTRGWDWCSGYHISDSILVGFSHTHLSGTGIGELGDVTFLPISYVDQKEVKFSHENEMAHPGYYAIKLNQPNVFVELTATQRVGFHRYTFGGDATSGLLAINLKQGIGWDGMTACHITIENDTTVSGYRRSSGWAEDQWVYFVATFSHPVDSHRQYGDTLTILSFKDLSQPLMVKCALSAVSVDNARENMRVELPGWDFHKAVAAADDAWNEELSKISINEYDDDLSTIFYTALYHTMTAPSVFCDVNGDYRGADGQVHHGDFVNYTTFSLWDTYRAAHPLMTLIHPEMQADIAATFMHIYEQQGKLPVWHLMGNETNCMVGNPGVPVLADLILKGLVKDREATFQAMKTSAMLDERGMDLLKKHGYLPYDKDSAYETVSKGLEYAIADAAIAAVAKKLGKKDDYLYFINRSKSYQKYFDPQTKFMRGRGVDGSFHEPFNPFSSSHLHDDYTEGNAWQYTWLVPHDVKGLIKLFGGEKPFVEKLDSLFVVHGDLGKDASPDISGLMGQYAHGNEPNHHTIYLYNYAGQPYKTARLLRQTMSEMYGNDYDGLCGNEDVGQMSAWYVLSALGLYQVEPAGGKFVIGSPLYSSSIRLDDDKYFHIHVINPSNKIYVIEDGKSRLKDSDENIYVQRAWLNGKPYHRSYIMYDDIMRGGTLELEMGPKPSVWGTQPKHRP
ncbi:MAG: GH92 family glycosyl hydrolase [Prevotella sp.]|nr:GH92 family glycosyl hydrolase [Prevotella sp.]